MIFLAKERKLAFVQSEETIFFFALFDVYRLTKINKTKVNRY